MDVQRPRPRRAGAPWTAAGARTGARARRRAARRGPRSPPRAASARPWRRRGRRRRSRTSDAVMSLLALGSCRRSRRRGRRATPARRRVVAVEAVEVLGGAVARAREDAERRVEAAAQRRRPPSSSASRTSSARDSNCAARSTSVVPRPGVRIQVSHRASWPARRRQALTTRADPRGSMRAAGRQQRADAGRPGATGRPDRRPSPAARAVGDDDATGDHRPQPPLADAVEKGEEGETGHALLAARGRAVLRAGRGCRRPPSSLGRRGLTWLAGARRAALGRRRPTRPVAALRRPRRARPAAAPS